MTIFLELASLGVFAASTVAQAGTAPDWVLNVGALGLCGFMVFQNYRQQEATGKVLKTKDEQLALLTGRLEKISANQTAAMTRLADCLADRPCISSDHRVLEEAKDPT